MLFRSAFEAQPGWHGEGSDRYYILETSREQAVGWLKLDEGTYYFNDEADMQFGWQEIDGAKYYFDESGKMTVGEAEVDGVAYLFQEDGKMLSGWNDDHLYGENGYPLTNQFLELKDGTVYYLDENGKKATGWQTIDDKRYYFQEDGTLARDMVREGKEVYTTRTSWSWWRCGTTAPTSTAPRRPAPAACRWAPAAAR